LPFRHKVFQAFVPGNPLRNPGRELCHRRRTEKTPCRHGEPATWQPTPQAPPPRWESNLRASSPSEAKGRMCGLGPDGGFRKGRPLPLRQHQISLRSKEEPGADIWRIRNGNAMLRPRRPFGIGKEAVSCRTG
jgi:hypothetical protein